MAGDPQTGGAPGPHSALAKELLASGGLETALAQGLETHGGRTTALALLEMEREDPSATRKALQALGKIKSPESAACLVAFRDQTAVKALRKVAGTSIARLDAAGVEIPTPGEPGARFRGRGPDPTRHALVGPYDVYLSYELLIPVRGRGGRDGLLLDISEEEGIVDATVAAGLSRSEFQRFQGAHLPPHQQMVPVPLAYGWHLFHQAKGRNEATGKALPTELVPWLPHVPPADPGAYPGGLLAAEAPGFWKDALEGTDPGLVRNPPADIVKEPEIAPLALSRHVSEQVETAAVNLLHRQLSQAGLVLSETARGEMAERELAKVVEAAFGGTWRAVCARAAHMVAYRWWLQGKTDYARIMVHWARWFEEESRPIHHHPLARMLTLLALLQAMQTIDPSAVAQSLGPEMLRRLRRLEAGEDPAGPGAESGPEAQDTAEGPAGGPLQEGAWQRRGGLYLPR